MDILVTDFHTHILPEIDDGSRSVEESVEMIHSQLHQGVKNIFLTPHFCGKLSYPEDFLEKRRNSFERLKSAIAHDGQQPNFVLGAEVEFCPRMSQWEQLSLLTLGNTDYILIEMPAIRWTDEIFDELRAINIKRGLIPILAHLERYLPLLGINRFMKTLSELPALLQVNCSFFNEKRTRNLALKLLREQKIQLVGSDCHGSAWRPPCMALTREILLNCTTPEVHSYISKIEESVLVGKYIINVNTTL